MNEPQLSSQLEPNPSTTPWFLAIIGFVLAGCAAFAIDKNFSSWCIGGNIPGDLKKIFTFSETFGHGTGIALILITMFVLDPAHRRKLPRIITCLLGAALAANLVKLMVARYRPKAFDLSQPILDSFHSLFPFGSGGHSLQSIPSAHTTGAVALACCLSSVYPRGRWWFAILAALAAMQRIVSGAHFLSDTCFGAALGLLISVFILKVGPLARGFTRFEQKTSAPKKV